MQKSNVVEESVEVLKVLRTELHGSVESSVIEQLDQVVCDLELLQGTGTDRQTSQKVLEILGVAIDLAGLGATIYQLVAIGCK